LRRLKRPLLAVQPRWLGRGRQLPHRRDQQDQGLHRQSRTLHLFVPQSARLELWLAALFRFELIPTLMRMLMQISESKSRIPIITLTLILAAALLTTAAGQEQRWIRIGEAQGYFRDDGAEPEQELNFLTWPTLYGDNQHTTRFKG